MATDTAVAGMGAGSPSVGASKTAWYGVAAQDVASRLGVTVDGGLSSAEVARRLAQNGPNALLAEKAVPGGRRFAAQYRNHVQTILVAAAVGSMPIREITKGIVVPLITVPAARTARIAAHAGAAA